MRKSSSWSPAPVCTVEGELAARAADLAASVTGAGGRSTRKTGQAGASCPGRRGACGRGRRADEARRIPSPPQ
eukprot:2577177-Pyramimonas_sp.AAC.1